MSVLRTVHVGLGTIGRQIAAVVVDRGIGRPVAAADANPELQRRTLGAIIGRQELDDVKVAPDLEGALNTALGGQGADLVILATLSRLSDVYGDILCAIRAGMDVVSTAEELVWPWLRHPQLAQQIAEEATHQGVTVVGTGINPGFLLDLFPLLVCRACVAVRRVTARRIVDVSLRRPQLQAKVGSGLTADEYRARVAEGQIGHVGLGESAALLAAGLGWPTGPVTETMEPVLAQERWVGEYYTIEPGQVIGSHQEARISLDDGRAIELVCRMTHGEPNPRDEITVEGDPPIRLCIEGGIAGDTATAGCTAGILRHAAAAPPGLLTVKDLPVA